MRTSRMLLAVPLFASTLLLGDAAARPSQQAQAAEWNWYVSPDVIYCEGCCTEGLLCCYDSRPCRITPS